MILYLEADDVPLWRTGGHHLTAGRELTPVRFDPSKKQTRSTNENTKALLYHYTTTRVVMLLQMLPGASVEGFTIKSLYFPQ